MLPKASYSNIANQGSEGPVELQLVLPKRLESLSTIDTRAGFARNFTGEGFIYPLPLASCLHTFARTRPASAYREKKSLIRD